jgi:hypothetical protein
LRQEVQLTVEAEAETALKNTGVHNEETRHIVSTVDALFDSRFPHGQVWNVLTRRLCSVRILLVRVRMWFVPESVFVIGTTFFHIALWMLLVSF